MSADYIAELADAIRHLYHREPVYVETVPVKEVFQGQTVWEGEVEVFDLPDSPDADRIYAWSHETDNVDQPRRTVTVLACCACSFASISRSSIHPSRLQGKQ